MQSWLQLSAQLYVSCWSSQPSLPSLLRCQQIIHFSLSPAESGGNLHLSLRVPVNLLELLALVLILMVCVSSASPSGLVLSDRDHTCLHYSRRGTVVSGCRLFPSHPATTGWLLRSLMCEALLWQYLFSDIDFLPTTTMRGCWCI